MVLVLTMQSYWLDMAQKAELTTGLSRTLGVLHGEKVDISDSKELEMVQESVVSRWEQSLPPLDKVLSKNTQLSLEL